MSGTDYDVIVIGGGPAGATCGALLAQHGHKTLILERTQFPRFHIGESLMPDTYWVFKRLGVLDKMKRSRFVKKYSVAFANAQGKESAPFYFDEMNPHECSQTWQVLRSEFDQMMLENAAEKGAEVWQNTLVRDVLTAAGAEETTTPSDGEHRPPAGAHQPPADAPGDGDRAAGGQRLPRVVGVIAERQDGTRVELRAKVVVDATGTTALLANKFGLRQPDPKLKKAAVFAHFKGALRDPAPRDEGATLVLSVQEQNGWFWYIPLHNDIVSVGVVGDIDYLIKGRGKPEQVLEEEIQRCPVIVPRLARAERIGPVHVLSDFSYNARRCAGDGWVLVGDAFTFLDPIYSSGVLLALTGGQHAADAIHAALQANDPSAARLGAWGDAFYAGLQRVRKLVYAFYTKGFSFGEFNRAHPEHRRNLVELLVGDVFRAEAGKIFETMQRYCHLPEEIRLEPAGRE